MHKLTRKTVAIAAGTVVLLSGASVAFAYWTSGGSGAGTVTTGTSAPITANQTEVVTHLVPGGAPQKLSGTFTNTSSAPVFVTTVTASILSVSGGDGDCSAADYNLVNNVMDVNASVPVGDSVGAWGVPSDVATIQFNNTALNQDGCKNATVNLRYLIS